MEENNYLEIINDVINMIKKGVVTEDGKIRPYDLIDFYTTYKVDFEKLYNYKKIVKLNLNDNKILSNFMSQYKSYGFLTEQLKPLSEHAINNFLEIKNEFNCKRDEKGMPIIGTGKIIDKSEKEKIVEYLVSNEIPLNIITCRIALQRYVDGNLFPSKNQTR